MMQASGNQLVETLDGPPASCIASKCRATAGPGNSPVWDLTEARVVIDAVDYRVTELAVSGSFLRQPYSLSYQLDQPRASWVRCSPARLWCRAARARS